MASRKKILFPRSDIPGRAPTLNEIDFGEIAINTHDGKAYIKKNKDGELSIQSIGAEDVDNVYYVSQSGTKGNDGKSLMNSFATLDSAVAVVYAKQSFKFDRDVCHRDLNLIMDNVRYDMLLGTNFGSIISGQSYKRGNAAKVTAEQLYQTRRAINEERLGMISVPEVKTSSIAKQRVSAGFDEIIEILVGGDASEFVYPDPPIEYDATDGGSNAAAQILIDNKDAIQDAVLDYLNDPANDFLTGSYNATKCARDVGLIVNAVARDLIMGTNYNTVTAGWAYNRANSAYVLSDQKDATIAGVNFARDYVTALSGVTSDTDIEQLFRNVTVVLDGSQTVYPAINYPQTPGATYQSANSSARVNAAAAIKANRATLVADTTKYINDNFTGIGSTCERDLGLILDAVRRDLILGTDYNSITAGNSYLRANSAYVLSEQKNVTIALVEYARDQVKALADVTSDSQVDTLFARVIDVLNGTNTTVQPVTTYPVVGTYASTRQVQHDAIQGAKTTLVESVTQYIFDNYEQISFKYDRAKCSRDVDNIINAVARDLLLGTDYNTYTAGNAYQRANSAYVLSDQKQITIDAVNLARDTLIALPAITSDATITTLFARVTSFISDTPPAYPTINYPTTAGSTYQTADRIAAAAAIQANRQTLIEGTSTYISQNWFDLDIGATCERDLGLILDAVERDLLTGSDYWTLTAGNAYLRGASAYVLSTQSAVTKILVEYARDLVKALPNVTSDATIDTLFKRVTDILDTTISTIQVPTGFPITGTYAGSNSRDLQRDDLVNNRALLISDTTAYINVNFPLLVYDVATCERDTGMIIDALIADLTYGGNSASRDAALAYFSFGTAQLGSGEESATVAAYNDLATRIKALTNVSEDARVDELIGITTGVITAGNVDSIAALSEISTAGYTTTEFDAITAAESTITSDTIAHGREFYQNYDQDACERDVGYILDALAHDVKYGGNVGTRINAEAYFVGTVSQLGPGVNSEGETETQATIAAYNDLKTRLNSVVTTSAEQTVVGGLVDIITGVLTAGNLNSLPAEVEVSTAGLTTTEFDELQSNITSTQEVVIDFVNTFVGYDVAACERDTGFLIDALLHDLLYSGNSASRSAALAYYSFAVSLLGTGEGPITVEAYGHLISEIQGLTNVTEDVRVAELIDITRDAITAGNVDSVPAEVDISTAGLTTTEFDAITNNKTIISDATLLYGQTNYSFYDQAACARDAGYILDAVAHDVQYGGNTATRTNAEAYYVGSVLQLGNGEIEATVAAYNDLKTRTQAIIATTLEQNAAGLKFDVITDVIENGLVGLPAEVQVVTTGLDTTEFDAIIAGISATQAATIDYVNLNWATQLAGYDAGKCARDVGLILDAVRRDLLLGTTFWTKTAGFAYLRANSAYVLSDQKQATIDAVNFVRDEIFTLTGLDLNYLFVNVLNVLNGTITEPGVIGGWVDTGAGTYSNTRFAQAQDIINNYQTLIDDTTTYIFENYDGIGFEYDVDKCSRDVEEIIKAVSRDLILGTDYNTNTAGNAYQRANSAYVLSDQKQITIDAVNVARDYLKDLTDVTSDATIDTLFARITSYISDTPPVYPSINYPNTVGSVYQTANRIAAAAAIQSNRASIISDTTEYINDNFSGLGTTCERDLSLIIDAVRRDLVLGTDYNTLTAANSYLRSTSAYVLSDQRDVTIALVEYARDQIKALPNVSSDATVDTLFGRVIDVLNGTTTTPHTSITYPVNGTYANVAGRAAQSQEVQANRQVLIDDTTNYLDTYYPELVYDQVACRRDTGFLIDAISHDLLYGGNTACRTAALAYFSGTNSQLGSQEELPTVAAYEVLKSNIQLLINVFEDARVATLVDIVRDVISAGNTSGIPAEVEIDTAGLSLTEWNEINTSEATIINDTIEYGRDNFSFYDQDKCERDVGYILDALSHDVQYGGNSATITNAKSYYVGAISQLGSGEVFATASAYENLKTLINAVVATTPEETYISNLLDIIITVVNDQSLDNLAAEIDIDRTGLNSTEYDALNTAITATQTEVIDYVNTFVGYNVAKCERDTLFLTEALIADLTYGGNSAMRNVAKSYFVGTQNQLGVGESLPTIDAYNDYARRVKLLPNVTEDVRVDELIAIVTNVIAAGGIDDIPAEVDIDTTGFDTTNYDLIKNDTGAIQNRVIDYVNDSTIVSNFDQHKCERDTGLIVDAIALDLQNNTNYNSITAGLAYQRGNAQKVQSDQLQYTVDSINYLRDQINATAGLSEESQTFITARAKEITDLLEETGAYGAEDGDPIFFDGSGQEDADKRNAANALIVNRRKMQRQIITWIQQNYDSLEYNQDKCERDVGYIVDALTHDILFGGTFASDTNARSYWVGTDLDIEGGTTYEDLDGQADNWTNQLGDGEIVASVAAYEQLKVFANSYISTSAEETRVNQLLDIIINAIQITPPASPSVDELVTVTLPAISGQAALFHTNKTTLQQQTVFYANSVFPTYSYDQATCRRDVGYIVDGLVYDLKYGGNSATSYSMRSYFSVFNKGYADILGDSELAATVAAYEQLKIIIGTQGVSGVHLTRVGNLLDLIIHALEQSSTGIFQIGDFFGPNGELYQYNYPFDLAVGFNTLTFPDPIALGIKITYPDIYEAFTEFNKDPVVTSVRQTIITQSLAVSDNQGADTTIFLKSGDYTVNNPIKLPPKTAIIGDALRSTTIRPRNVDSDIFWVDNGCYVKEITFRDHQNGAACVAFDPRNDNITGPFITQSPYVQNCTSLTTSGIGMKIDGSKVSGLRSMVLDAFTQFNADGIGVLLKERAYAQLVSCFTISTSTSIKAESGAQCSITNSNSSFGDFGLVATGGSKSIYNGSLHADYNLNDDIIRVNGILNTDSANYSLNLGDFKTPNYNDAIKFSTDSYYYTILNVSDEILQNWSVSGNEDQIKIASNDPADFGTGFGVRMSKNDQVLAFANIEERNVEILNRDVLAWTNTSTIVPTNPVNNAADSDAFGQQIVMSEDGTTIVVAAPANRHVVGGVGLTQYGGAYVYHQDSVDTSLWNQVQFIQDSVSSSPNPNTNRRLGDRMSLSADGNTLLLSNRADSDAGFISGSVQIWGRDSANDVNGYQFKQKLLFPKGTAALAPRTTINEDGIAVLVSWRGNTHYYYTKNQFGNYSISQNVTSQLAQNDEADFEIVMNKTNGYAAFTSSQTALTAIDSAPSQATGSVFLQVNDASKFEIGQRVYASSATTIEYTSKDTRIPDNTTIVDIVGNTLELSNPTTGTIDGNFDYIFGYHPNSGGVELYRFNEGSWSLQELVYPRDARTDQGFGTTIDMNTKGDLVIVGQNPRNDLNDSCAVYMVERAGTNWSEVAMIKPQTVQKVGDGNGSTADDRFGRYATIGGTGDYIAVSADKRTVEGDNGAVFTYSSILPETGSYELTIAPPLNKNAGAEQKVDFHQRSLISASSHTFEFVGSGTNMFAAIPQNGGIPKKENEIVFDSAESLTPNFGLVYFTATDELGDFRIGGDLTINRESGTITGTTFDRSLFAVLTPYILALEG